MSSGAANPPLFGFQYQTSLYIRLLSQTPPIQKKSSPSPSRPAAVLLLSSRVWASNVLLSVVGHGTALLLGAILWGDLALLSPPRQQLLRPALDCRKTRQNIIFSVVEV